MSEPVESVSTVQVVVGLYDFPVALGREDDESGLSRDDVLRDVVRRCERASLRAVPAEWWEAYRAKEIEIERLRQELHGFPKYVVTWHARLSLDGALVGETSAPHPNPPIPTLPMETKTL